MMRAQHGLLLLPARVVMLLLLLSSIAFIQTSAATRVALVKSHSAMICPASAWNVSDW
jgi:hypothetical protein